MQTGTKGSTPAPPAQQIWRETLYKPVLKSPHEPVLEAWVPEPVLVRPLVPVCKKTGTKDQIGQPGCMLRLAYPGTITSHRRRLAKLLASMQDAAELTDPAIFKNTADKKYASRK